MTTTTKLESELCFAIYSTGHAYNRIYKPLLDMLGLTYPQYLVMLLLWEQDRQTVGQICNRMLVEASTVTPLLQRLEIQGLIRRLRDTEDRRLVWALLTEKGRELQSEASRVPTQVRRLIGWPDQDMAGLAGELTRLRNSLTAGVTRAPGSSPQDKPSLA